MNVDYVAEKLLHNSDVFLGLLSGTSKTEYTWKPQPDKWCLLEIICHLYDEEREDFRARLMHVLENPERPLPSIDPTGWVKERKYMEQDFEKVLEKFTAERKKSVDWLRSLSDPKWNNAYQHPKFGALSAEMFLNNWLAHDYLHIRQIVSVKYHFLKNHSKTGLDYAGNW